MTAAREAADADGFAFSSSEPAGRLLAVLAAAAGPGARLGESGTGYGVGAAWRASAMAADARLVTVERDPVRAAGAAAALAGDPRVDVLTGDWSLLAGRGPFDLLFCDGGGKRDAPDAVVDLLAPGGILVLDDFVPHDGPWPPLFQGRPDTLRIRYLTDPRLVAAEVRVSAGEAVIVAVRR